MSKLILYSFEFVDAGLVYCIHATIGEAEKLVKDNLTIKNDKLITVKVVQKNTKGIGYIDPILKIALTTSEPDNSTLYKVTYFDNGEKSLFMFTPSLDDIMSRFDRITSLGVSAVKEIKPIYTKTLSGQSF